MAAITAAMVKELREMTGAGMMDCKKALAQTDGDMDKAVDFLREKGLAASAKKAGRIAAEGIAKTLVSEDGKTGVVVEVNSETDFVAKNADFQEYVAQVATQAINSDAADMDAFMNEKWYLVEDKTVAEALSGKVAVIGENLKIRRYEKVTAENGIVVDYVHAGGKIGVLVVAECPSVNDDIKEALKNIAMQIAALKPVYVNRSEISQDFIEKEKEILMVAAKNEKPDAPEKVLSGMVMGRLNKELKEFCLVDQVYVKAEDGKQLVGKYIEEVAKKAGTTLAVVKFVRYETGEGLEKKNENFAEEVAKQMAGN